MQDTFKKLNSMDNIPKITTTNTQHPLAPKLVEIVVKTRCVNLVYHNTCGHTRRLAFFVDARYIRLDRSDPPHEIQAMLMDHAQMLLIF